MDKKKIKYEKTAEGKWMASVLGIMERGMCTASWFLGYPQFVGIWLSIKTVGSWGRWQEEAEGRFSNFLFLRALSLSISAIIALITECFLNK